MTTRKKKRQQDGGGFLKKVSSLFNLDTVTFLFLLFSNFPFNLFLYDFFLKSTNYFSFFFHLKNFSLVLW